jgi:hypothetical protein
VWILAPPCKEKVNTGNYGLCRNLTEKIIYSRGKGSTPAEEEFGGLKQVYLDPNFCLDLLRALQVFPTYRSA